MALTISEADQLIQSHTRIVAAPTLVDEPLVSVAVLTFNHAPFIKQALQSILAQQTDFPFEVVVGDDGSDDGTTDVVRQFQQEHPQQTKLLLADRNLGAYTKNGRLNMIRTLNACRGKYTAMLEGDDYWTDPAKLQRQVELLEDDETLAFCHHRVRIIKDDDEFLANSVYPFRSYRMTLEDLARSMWNPVYTASLVFRTRAFPGFPAPFLKLHLGDWTHRLLLLQNGDGLFVDRVMSCYRKHGGGFWIGKSRSWQRQQLVRMARVLRNHFNKTAEHRRLFSRLLWRQRFALIDALRLEDPQRARRIKLCILKQRPLFYLIEQTRFHLARLIMAIRR